MAKLAKDKTRLVRTVVKLSRSPRKPRAKEFLTHYFALERPNTAHLFFSKGLIDFMLGLAVGVLIGLLIAAMTA